MEFMDVFLCKGKSVDGYCCCLICEKDTCNDDNYYHFSFL